MITLFLVLFPFLSLADESADEKTAILEPIVVKDQKRSTEGIAVPSGKKEISGTRWRVQGETVEAAFAEVPGIAFSAAGGSGQTRSVFIRGARAEDTLVLLDGIPLNDPLSPSRSFDFSQIPTALEKIEILKGAQSVGYGSDALGGVILLTSKDSAEPQAQVEGGSYGTIKARAAHLGFRASYERSDGFSAADAKQGNTEKDGFRSYSFGGKKSYSLGTKGLLEAQGFYQYNLTETDRDGGPGGDSLGTQTKNRSLTFRLGESHDLGDGLSLQSGVSHFSKNRDDNTAGPAFYRSQQWRGETFLKKEFASHSPSAGIDFSLENGRSSDFSDRKSLQSLAGFAQWDWRKSSLEGSHGARIDFPAEHQKAVTYRSALGYWLLEDSLKLRASIGSGYKTPSLFQTYSRFGARNLKPSRSVAKDLTLEYFTGDSQTELTAFQNLYRDLIDFQSTPSPGSYRNIGRAESVGLEFGHRHQLGLLYLDTAFTWMNARDRTNGNQLRRRPNLFGSGELGFQKGDFAGAGLQMRWVGKRVDTLPIFPYSAQNMPSFSVLRFSAFHRIQEIWKVTFRIENLLNRSYQETSGFGTAERSFYLGIEWN
jgi:vitamin B12 transporter